MLISALTGGRKLSKSQLDDTWDQILEGVNPNIVEVVGLRRGSWGDAIFNRFFFFTPNMRLSVSQSKIARSIVDQYTDTAIVKTGKATAVSFERLKSLLELHANDMKLQQKAIYEEMKSRGGNFARDIPGSNQGAKQFDIAVEMAYRRGESNIDPRLEMLDVNGNKFRPFATRDGGPLNDAALIGLKDAVKLFTKEQNIFDDIVVLSGMVTRQEIRDRKAFYRLTHGENFVHRIIDHTVVNQHKIPFMTAIKAGWKDLAEKQRGPLRTEISNLETSLEAAKLELARLSGERTAATSTARGAPAVRREIHALRRELADLEQLTQVAAEARGGLGRRGAVPSTTHALAARAARALFGESFRDARAVSHAAGGTMVVVRRGGTQHPLSTGIDNLEDGWWVYHLPDGADLTPSQLAQGGVGSQKKYDTLKEAKVAARENASNIEVFRLNFREIEVEVEHGFYAGTDPLERTERSQVVRRELAEKEAALSAIESAPSSGELRQGVRGQEDLVSAIEEGLAAKKLEEGRLEWNEDIGKTVWSGWALPSDAGHLTRAHSDPIMARSFLIADRFIEPFLRVSANAQRYNFYNGIGLKSVAFQRLAHTHDIDFQTRTQALLEESRKIETTIRNAENMDANELARHEARVRDIEDELIVRTETRRMHGDARLNPEFNTDTLKQILGEVVDLQTALIAARKAVRNAVGDEAVDSAKAAHLALIETYNTLSGKIARGGAEGSTESIGQIRAHRALPDSSPINPPDSVAVRAMALDRAMQAEVIAWRINRLLPRVLEERAVTWQRAISKDSYIVPLLREYNEKIAAGGREKPILKAKNKAIKDMEIIHDRLFNVHMRIPESERWAHGTTLLRNYNYATSMGGVTLSSFPDIAMGLFTAGLGPYLAATRRYAFYRFKRWVRDMPPEEHYFMQDYIFALEQSSTAAKGRAGSMAEVEGSLAGKRQLTISERTSQLSQSVADTTTMLGLLGKWNGFWKATNSLAASSRLGRISERLALGKSLKPGDKRFIDMLKIGEDDLVDINKLINRYGEVVDNTLGGKFYQSGAVNWKSVGNLTDRRVLELKTKMYAAMSLNGDLSILTPGAGNVPGMADRSWQARIVFQFQKFFMVGTENLLIPMIQRLALGDLQAYTTLVGLATCGVIVTSAKDAMRGRDSYPHITGGKRAEGSTSEQYYQNVARLAINAVDRSGGLGMLTQLWLAAETTAYPPSQFIVGDDETSSRAKQKSPFEAFAGPTVGKITDAIWLGNEAMKIMMGDTTLTARHLSKGRRMVPWQNVLPFTALADYGYNAYVALESHRNRPAWKRDWKPSDFYWRQFKFIEHRIAPSFVDVDFTNWSPKRSIMRE
jgi:hypothetical protein